MVQLPLRLMTGVALLAGSVLSTACVDIVANDSSHVERDEKRFAVTGQATLNLTTFDGAIEVTSWDRPEVLVVVEKRGADAEAVATIDVDIRQDGNDISVRADRRGSEPQTFGWHRSRVATVFVTAPATTTVSARTGDGHISVRDLRAELSLQTGDGAIRVDDVEGRVDAQSGDGSIRINGALTRVRARSGDGSVTIRARDGSAAQDDWTISTGDGSVTVELPDTFNAELDAHSGDGRVRADRVGLEMSRRDGRDTLRGRIGDGGKDLRIRTGDGSITIRRY